MRFCSWYQLGTCIWCSCLPPCTILFLYLFFFISRVRSWGYLTYNDSPQSQLVIPRSPLVVEEREENWKLWRCIFYIWPQSHFRCYLFCAIHPILSLFLAAAGTNALTEVASSCQRLRPGHLTFKKYLGHGLRKFCMIVNSGCLILCLIFWFDLHGYISKINLFQ